MMIRDGLPSLATCLWAVGGFVLFVVLNVIWNRLGERRVMQLLGQLVATCRPQRMAGGLERLAQVNLLRHTRLLVIGGILVAVIFFCLRIQGS